VLAGAVDLLEVGHEAVLAHVGGLLASISE
jgi:hypothetical protein